MKEFKIVVIGNGGVGKSSLTLQFVQGIFESHYNATIEDSYRKRIQLGSDMVQLEIIDTCGTEQFSSLRDDYYSSAHGFILVFSLSDRQSFEDMKGIHSSITASCPLQIPIILVGNKYDLLEDRAVDKCESLGFSKKSHLIYFETSAKQNMNVNEIFEECAKMMQQYNEEQRQTKESESKLKQKVKLLLVRIFCFR